MKAGRLQTKPERDFQKLVEAVSRMAPAAIAFSGGVDSALLAIAAYRANPSSIMVTVENESVSKKDVEDAKQMAKNFGLKHVLINGDRPKEFYENGEMRCYYCKKDFIKKVKEEAGKAGIRFVLEGSNMDDAKDYRPGMKAVREEGARSPLMELGFRKEDVREMAKMLGIPVWDKPSSPCLGTRVPQGTRISKEQLKRIGDAEEFIRKEFGVSVLRVRDDGEKAKVQVGLDEMEKVSAGFARIEEELKKMGYKKVVLDEGGYKSGG